MPEIVSALLALARKNGYGKVVARVPLSNAGPFLARAFHREAAIPDFYPDGGPQLFLTRFLSPERAREHLPEAFGWSGTMVAAAIARRPKKRFMVERCRESDAARMSRLYQSVFSSYPSPIFDPGYLKDAMRRHVDFFRIRKDGDIVALGACEMEEEFSAVEMTDFAVLSEFRGTGMAGRLLAGMEAAMRTKGFRTAYATARTRSPAMNRTFQRGGYRRCGKLVNHAHIAGGIESFWVWFKPLADVEAPLVGLTDETFMISRRVFSRMGVRKRAKGLC